MSVIPKNPIFRSYFGALLAVFSILKKIFLTAKVIIFHKIWQLTATTATAPFGHGLGAVGVIFHNCVICPHLLRFRNCRRCRPIGPIQLQFGEIRLKFSNSWEISNQEFRLFVAWDPIFRWPREGALILGRGELIFDPPRIMGPLFFDLPIFTWFLKVFHSYLLFTWFLKISFKE